MQQLTQYQDVTVHYQKTDPVRNQHTQKMKATILLAVNKSTAPLILLWLHHTGSITAFRTPSCQSAAALLLLNRIFRAHSYS